MSWRRSGSDPMLALTAVSELLARGYRIHEDMSVVGFGDFSASTQISPHLTTIKVQGVQVFKIFACQSGRRLKSWLYTGVSPFDDE